MKNSILLTEDDMRITPYLEMGEMPEFLASLLSIAKDDTERDMLLLSVLTAASSVLPNLYFRHGSLQKRYYANLLCFVEAPAAYGKSIAGVGSELLKAIDKETPLFVAGNSTHAAFVDRLRQKKGVAYSYTSEGSVITNIWKKNGCSGYSDLLRQAAEHETIHVSRKTEPDIVIKNPRLSMLITGTFDQFRAFLPSAQNGLFSRILTLVIREQASFDASVFMKGLIESEESGDSPQLIIAQHAQRLLGLYERLYCAEGPVLFRFTAEQAEELGQTFREEGLALMEKLGPNFHSCVARTAVNTERIAMVLTALRNVNDNTDADANVNEDVNVNVNVNENIKEGTVWVCDERDYRAAAIIGQKLLFHIADAYTQVGADEEEAIPKAKKSLQRDTFYSRLPDTFETGECVEESKKMGVHERTVKRWIECWMEEGKVLKTFHGHYQKIA